MAAIYVNQTIIISRRHHNESKALWNTRRRNGINIHSLTAPCTLQRTSHHTHDHGFGKSPVTSRLLISRCSSSLLSSHSSSMFLPMSTIQMLIWLPDKPNAIPLAAGSPVWSLAAPRISLAPAESSNLQGRQ